MGKQVKTPRFYVDMPTFLHATGQLGWDATSKGGAELLYMNPSNPFMRFEDSDSTLFLSGASGNTPKTSFPMNFCALLNHNFASDSHYLKIVGYHGLNDVGGINFANGWVNPTQILNSNFTPDGENNYIDPEYNGTTIWSFNTIDKYWRSFLISAPNGDYDDSVSHQLGSLVVGKYFDCPNSPDLNLTMSRRFDGIKSQKTIGGKTLSNIYYDGPTEWTMNGPNGTYKYPPFELDLSGPALNQDLYAYRAKSGLGRKGLRSWKLTFSYISEDDMWMAYESSSITPFTDGETGTNATTDSEVPTDDGNSVSSFENPNPMLSDNSFNFVWNCTLGGTLPFIFQPDNTNNNPDQFSICTFRENTFSVQQQAHNVYKVSMTIDELA